MRFHREPPWGVALFATLAALAVSGCGARPVVVEHAKTAITGATMGTVYKVTVTHPEGLPGDADAVSEAIRSVVDEELDLVDKAMSTWRKDSELSQFNRHEALTPFPVSKETAEVMALAVVRVLGTE